MTLSASTHVQQDARKMTLPDVVVIIVAFGNAGDIVGCLRALSRTRQGPRFDVFIAENGGPEALAALLDALMGPASPCCRPHDSHNFIFPSSVSAAMSFSLPRADGGSDAAVHVAKMPENLGYAGGINKWLRPLLDLPGWQAAWILNPDTQPAPLALLELADHANKRSKGMVGSRIVPIARLGQTHACGLRWCKITSRTVSIGHAAITTVEPNPDNVEALLDAPDGASIYVTRSLIERIGLMDERYFLYYEDLEWGLRAKMLNELGYAHRSLVPHKGGTTIGSSPSRSTRSHLAVYMEFRNRILFVRQRYGAWLPWAVLMQMAHITAYLFAGSITNMMAAGRGSLAGLWGEIGKPVNILQAHTVRSARSPQPVISLRSRRNASVSIGSPDRARTSAMK
jgi:N-acetylglucosaminyl-diphospho-decaprenol L-rhamnosyltransferase